MSVVNQMLKDLDKRQQPHNLAHVPAGQASQAAANPWWLQRFDRHLPNNRPAITPAPTE